MITALIKTLLDAASSYFRSRTSYYDLSSKKLIYVLIAQSEQRQADIRKRIESLREAVTEEATQNADALFVELQKEKKKYENYLRSADGAVPGVVRDET